MPGAGRRRAAVVTGGGGGIGTAIALELARRGIAVIAMDPGTGVQGEPLNEPTAAQTAQLITAQGGVARASTASVTDRAAVRSLFAGVVAEFGSLDIVVNTAGILRFAPFGQASQDDWAAVLGVHLGGYLNVLAEAVPIMAAAGYGRIVGVTSGAGLARAAAGNTPYSSAKRAVAAVTWQLAGLLPDGVVLNALSPIAATRMVSEGAAPAGGRPAGRARGGGLDLSAMPAAQDMAPAAAYLASDQIGCRGQVIFSAGPELSVISPPQLIEAVRTERSTDFAASLDTLFPVVLGPAEAGQRSTGGANPRFGPVFDQPGTTGPVASGDSAPHYCLVITDNAAIARSLVPALARCGLTAIDVGARPISPWRGVRAAGPAARWLRRGRPGRGASCARERRHRGGRHRARRLRGRPGPAAASWTELLAGFAPVTDCVLSHAAWLQAAARQAVRGSRPVRIVHLADATAAAAARRRASCRAAGALRHPGPAWAYRRVLGRPRDGRAGRS